MEQKPHLEEEEMATTPDVCLRQPAEWRGGPRTWAKGRAFQGDSLLDATALSRQFDACEDEAALVALAQSLNGHYAVIGRNSSAQFCVVDRARSYPLFWSVGDPMIIMADAAALAADEEHATRPSRDALVDFSYCGYVTGEKTLVPGVRQLQAGQVLWAPLVQHTDGPRRVASYHSFTPTIRSEAVKDAELLERAHVAMAAAVNRMLAVAADRTVILPLSGGYDSRVIAMMLKLFGYEDVICFSYGRIGNRESEISKAVAEQLGYRWIFIPYTERQWGQWVRSQAWRDYLDRAHLGVSLPLLQGWPCIGTLREDSQIPDNPLFVSGIFGGGLSAGLYARPHLVKQAGASCGRVAQEIVNNWFSFYHSPERRTIDLAGVPERIEEQLRAEYEGPWEADAVLYESWLYRNVLAKWVGNASRYYDSWGYDWWFPFADWEVNGFWQSVPYAKRLGMALNIEFTLGYLPDLLGAAGSSVLRLLKGLNMPAGSIQARARLLAARADRLGLLRRAKRALQGSNRTLSLDESYCSHPLALWGAVDRGVFDREYTGRESVFPFLAQQLLEERYGWSLGKGFLNEAGD